MADLTRRALQASNVAPDNAESVTRSVVAAEADGIHSHGLARLPTYCEHARCGKIDGHARPTLRQTAPAALVALVADARDGFAHPAIDLGFGRLAELARNATLREELAALRERWGTPAGPGALLGGLIPGRRWPRPRARTATWRPRNWFTP